MSKNGTSLNVLHCRILPSSVCSYYTSFFTNDVLKLKWPPHQDDGITGGATNSTGGATNITGGATNITGGATNSTRVLALGAMYSLKLEVKAAAPTDLTSCQKKSLHSFSQTNTTKCRGTLCPAA